MTDLLAPKLADSEINAISSLGLAHLGDAVFELMARTWLVANGKVTAKQLHRETVKIVKAAAQAEAARKLTDALTERELTVFKRGRNTHPHHTPNSVDVNQYRLATGLETLFGWLWLQGENDRLNDLFMICMQTDSLTENG